jgi:AcrR family transcriptional regulator
MVDEMTPKERWLHEGLTVLAELGAPALRIDRLAERLAMTKGSFYHHFDGLAGYKSDLLAHFAELSTMRYIEAVESEPNLEPRQKLNRLMTLVLHSPDDEGPLEIAFRAWAQQDRDVHEAQRRIDATRTDYLRDLCRGLGLPPRRALDMARVLYTVLIGSGHIVPPLEPADLRRLWTLTLEVLPPEE